ncbi:hypothetical protein AB0L57_16600 [Nocardia sp. NPDC052254]|uniref:hypothetical protein n=1 Tax=Nocardia sp. NPDC052254 TaxID=3155681 RepID=UPI0034395338
MGQELRVDEDRLREVAREYDSIADSVRRAYDELRAVMAEEGNFWGDDQTGRAFAETYVPDSHALMDSLKQMLTLLSGQGKALEGVLSNLEAADSAGKRITRNALSDNDFRSNTGASAPIAPAAAADRVSAGQPGDPARSSVPGTPPDVSVAPGIVAGAGPEGADPLGTKPSAATPNPAASDAAPATAGDSSSDASVPAAGGSQPASGVQASDAKRPAPRGAAENQTSKAADKPAAAQRADTPWSRSPRGTGSSAPAAPGKVSAPSTRPGGGHGGRPNAPGSKAPHGPNIRKPVSAAPIRAQRDEKPDSRRLASPDEARELAAILEERHGLRVVGFETPGIELDTLREIASALDDVLTAHPYLVLPEFAIADCGAEPIGLDRVGDLGERDVVPGVARMTLNIAVAKDVGLLAGQVAAECEDRPVYFTIARELGRVLDITGGLRAHSISQRRLISEYLSERGDNRFEIPVGAIVGDYRRWRGQLREHGLRGGRFEPGMALADAFVEVQMRMGEASAPAQVLQRLLVETAERYSSKDLASRPG